MAEEMNKTTETDQTIEIKKEPVLKWILMAAIILLALGIYAFALTRLTLLIITLGNIGNWSETLVTLLWYLTILVSGLIFGFLCQILSYKRFGVKSKSFFYIFLILAVISSYFWLKFTRGASIIILSTMSLAANGEVWIPLSVLDGMLSLGAIASVFSLGLPVALEQRKLIGKKWAPFAILFISLIAEVLVISLSSII